jgi:hypothetical protein
MGHATAPNARARPRCGPGHLGHLTALIDTSILIEGVTPEISESWVVSAISVAGSLPRRALVLVAEWAVLHEDELAANWERARRDEPLEPIDALA